MDKAVFLAALERAAPALSKKELLPVFGAFKFDGKHVTAYDDQVAVIAPCETPFRAVLNGEGLLTYVKGLGAREINVKEKDGSFVFSAGRSRLTMAQIPYDDHTFEPPKTGATGVVTFDDDALDVLRAGAVAMSSDESQAMFLGLFVALKGGKFYSIGSNGRYCLMASMEHPGDDVEGQLSPRFVKLLLAQKAKLRSLTWTGDWAVAETEDGVRVLGRNLGTGNGSKFWLEVPKKMTTDDPSIPWPEGFEEAIVRAAATADELPSTLLEVVDAEMALTTNGTVSRARDVLDLSVSLPEGKLKFNPHLLMPLMKPLNGAESQLAVATKPPIPMLRLTGKIGTKGQAFVVLAGMTNREEKKDDAAGE